YTCTSNKGYCTLSSNPDLNPVSNGFAKILSQYTCPQGQTCVTCQTGLSTECRADGRRATNQTNINSDGSGCSEKCTPSTGCTTAAYPDSSFKDGDSICFPNGSIFTCNSSGNWDTTGTSCGVGEKCDNGKCISSAVACNEDNWTSTLSPTACPVTGQQTKTWTKVGTCEGGVTHPSNETVSCTYNASDSVVNIKLAFAGVKKDNGKCAINWPVSLRMVDSSNNSIIDKILSGTPKQTGSVNEKGEIVYDFSVTVANVPETGVSKSAFFLTGSKHISVKYGENNQKAWYSTLAGTLGLTRGTTNSYDFSGYPLLAGDVTGDTVGKPDGKINGQDFSYIKEKANALLSAAAAGTNVEGDINGDCQANAGDVGLIKQSLKEINGQTY
ncbi:MAG: hypothetical protein WC720_04255, partial [Candidatus Shapirobacteria bacterium]